ncbi:carbon-nitrogen hydrolase family protein [Candidatus Bathyarchaeota archaeon]|nr:carbon-nitrogen hydrolase family protein [Candidatus Bathyarchaeota archaeon]
MGIRRVRVGLLKATPKRWDKEANWLTMERLIRDVAHLKIDIAVTPECFLDGYAVAECHERSGIGEVDWVKKFIDIAEDGENGAYIRKLSYLAQELGIYIIVGFTEKLDGKLFNAAYLFSRDGAVIGRYRKVNISSHERLVYCSGDSLPVFDTVFGRIGILICADRRWPENVRILALQGAEVIFIPAYGMWHEANTMWMRTRSYENGVYICFAHPNIALITNPKGDISAELISNVEDVLVHDIDLDLIDRTHIKERRPDLYSILCRNLKF